MRVIRVNARVLVAVAPAAADHRHAFRVVIGLAVPGIALLDAGRPDLIIYAVLGAFTGMYGRAETRWSRVAHQAQAAALLVTGVAVGSVLSSTHAPPWVLVAAEVGFAALGSVVTDLLALKPEGPFFGLFALGAVATIPAGHVAPWAAVSICAATALFCVVVSLAGALRRHGRGPATMPSVRAPRPSDLGVHALRYGLAISLAGVGGVFLGVDHANWAMAAAAVPLAAADVSSRVTRGVHRMVGTFAGLGVTALLLLPHLSATLLAVCVMALLFPTELFVARHYALALGFFTPLIMLMTDLAAPTEPVTLLAARGVDTLIGVGAGVAVAVLVRGPDRGHPHGPTGDGSRAGRGVRRTRRPKAMPTARDLNRTVLLAEALRRRTVRPAGCPGSRRGRMGHAVPPA